MDKKVFLITIDTEGDNLWNAYQTKEGNRVITTNNAKYILRFQKLCESYGFVPTYLTDYEMAMDDEFCKVGSVGIRKKTLEIGMHMHAWNCPPIHELPYNPNGHNAYAGEYPKEVLEQKMEYLTHLLQERFQCDITSHRGGRWYLDADIVKSLKRLGYIVDCTVTPGVSWKSCIGNRIDGNDYGDFPSKLYEMDVETLKEGNDGFLEIPPTILQATRNRWRITIDPKEAVAMFKGKERWMRPNGHNLNDMKSIIEEQAKNGEYIEFMIHSSELMPGGSPTFKTGKSIERMYRHLNIVFDILKNEGYAGMGISEFAKLYRVK